MGKVEHSQDPVKIKVAGTGDENGRGGRETLNSYGDNRRCG